MDKLKPCFVKLTRISTENLPRFLQTTFTPPTSSCSNHSQTLHTGVLVGENKLKRKNKQEYKIKSSVDVKKRKVDRKINKKKEHVKSNEDVSTNVKHSAVPNYTLEEIQKIICQYKLLTIPKKIHPSIVTRSCNSLENNNKTQFSEILLNSETKTNNKYIHTKFRNIRNVNQINKAFPFECADYEVKIKELDEIDFSSKQEENFQSNSINLKIVHKEVEDLPSKRIDVKQIHQLKEEIKIDKQENFTWNEIKVENKIEIKEQNKCSKIKYSQTKSKTSQKVIYECSKIKINKESIKVKEQKELQTKSHRKKRKLKCKEISEVLRLRLELNWDVNYVTIFFQLTSSEHLNKLAHNTIFDKLRSIFSHYYYKAIKPALSTLCSALSSAVKVFLSWRNRISETSSTEVDKQLKEYSSLFVGVFNNVQSQFSKEHKTFMVSVLYLLFLKNSSNPNLNPGLLKSVVSTLFRIECYSNSCDNILKSSLQSAKQTLGLLNRLLGVISKDLNLNGNRKTLLDCKALSKSSSTNVCEEQSKDSMDTTPSICQPVLQDAEDEDILIDKEIEMILDNHFHKRLNENRSFNTIPLEGLLGSDCSNKQSCKKKNSVPCSFCYELICCEDFCEVQEDQFFHVPSENNEFVVGVCCTEHKYLIWNENLYKDWNEAKDHPMPNNPVCWKVNCSKRAMVVCLCKARAYCSIDCQVEDWYDVHSSICSGQTSTDLLWNPSRNDHSPSAMEF